MKVLTVQTFILFLFLLWSVFWMLQFVAQILDNILHPKPFIIVRGQGGGDYSGGDCGGGDYGGGDCGDGGCGGDGGDGGGGD